jgi:hypothetical protein
MSDQSDICFEISDVTLIVQDQTNACWFASAMMVLDWKAARSGTPATVSVDPDTSSKYLGNEKINNNEIIPLANRLGLVAVPPMSPSVSGILGWLQNYGPLWSNGVEHIVVIAGIRSGGGSGYEVKVYDPGPGKGVGWRTLSGWFTGFDPGGNAESSIDTSDSVEAIFLHAP